MCGGGSSLSLALIKTIMVCIYKFINIFTTHFTIQKSLCHNISPSPFSLTSKPVLSTFLRALWVWPSPRRSHSHKLNRTHFHLLELSPQHNKQTTTEMINIQIIIHACSLSFSLTNQYDTLGRQGYNASVPASCTCDLIRTFILPLPINPYLFVYLNSGNHPVT